MIMHCEKSLPEVYVYYGFFHNYRVVKVVFSRIT